MLEVTLGVLPQAVPTPVKLAAARTRPLSGLFQPITARAGGRLAQTGRYVSSL
jgi:hypothetical protein